jgi:hypothetical protein
MTNITLYSVVSGEDYKSLQETGYLPFYSEDNSEALMDKWMIEQMRKRLSVDDMALSNGPHWCFFELHDCSPLTEFDKDLVVVQFKTQPTHVLFFDDSDWVQVANNVMNNEVVTYLAHSEKEADENKDATQAAILKSWERMFDITVQERDVEYCGDIQLRAVVPYITKNMITNIIYF